MTPSHLNILIVEDNPADAALLLRHLRKHGYSIHSRRVDTKPALRQALNEETWDVLIADYRLPQLDAPDSLAILQESNIDIPFIIVSGTVDEEMAVLALKAGAHDFLNKNNLHRLVPAIERELREVEVRRQRREARAAMAQQSARAETLLQVASELNARLELPAVVNTISNIAIRSFSVPIAGVVLYAEKQDTFQIAGLVSNLLPISLPLPAFPRGVVPSQSVVVFDDLSAFLGQIDHYGYLAQLGLRSGMVANIERDGRLIGALCIAVNQARSFNAEEADLLRGMADQAAVAIDNANLLGALQQSNAELAAAYDTTLEGWVQGLDLRDKETEGHTQRVAAMAVQLGEVLGLDAETLVHLRRGALLHDIGKMAIPDHILHKPGALTAEEWQIMRLHPVYARNWLAPIRYLEPALVIPYSHHERWDGRGYPLGLRGEDIPLLARIFAVVDVWDALRSDRPYKAALSADAARAIIQADAGQHFDPRIAEVFLQIVNRE